MKENKYDQPEFFESYSHMPRSVKGLAAAGEWNILSSMLPGLQGKSVLDLGCGYGWHCRYIREQGADMVIGVDISEKMLHRARQLTSDPGIEYRRVAIEDIEFEPGTFDLVFSSLALHYIRHYDDVSKKVYNYLKAGGSFVFSVEHPVFTAVAEQDWCIDAEGKRLHWPVDNYYDEGIRSTRFLKHHVIKYHRTFTTWIDVLISAGFSIDRIVEPQPDQQMLQQYPDMLDELRRPIFLLISAGKR